jgi:hypothetical protein
MLHVMMTQMSAKKGLQLFSEKVADSIVKEFKQLHNKEVFIPQLYNSITPEGRKKALRAITLIKAKKNGDIKGRTVADRRGQQTYIEEDDAASPTMSTKALLISCAIDATEQRKVITADISGAFLQADIDEFVTVVFEGIMVDLLIHTDPIYAKYVYTMKSGKKLIYV